MLCCQKFQTGNDNEITMSLRPGVKNYCDDIEEEDNKVGETNF